MILQPGAYKILWADEDTGQGADHMSFKLSAEGEAVGLYQKMGGNIHMIDEYVFGEQLFEGSFSRIPNATGSFVFTVSSTPDSFNEIITGIDEEVTVSIYPNPVTDYVFIDSPGILQNVELTDPLGRLIQSFSNIRQQQISMHNNAPGIYILRLKSGNRFKTLKIIKE